MDKTLFRKYDIRGRYPDQISKKDAYALGATYARSRGVKAIAVAYSGDSHIKVAAGLTEGLRAGGAEVYIVGVCTIDALAFAVATLEHDGDTLDGGIMVSGGRLEGKTGFKFMGREAAPVPPPEIEEVLSLIEDTDAMEFNSETKIYEAPGVFQAYVQHVLNIMDTMGGWPVDPSKPALTFIIDAPNYTIKATFDILISKMPIPKEKLNVIVNCTSTGPDPWNETRTENLQHRMKEWDADFAVSIDGDGAGIRCFTKGGMPVNAAHVGGSLMMISAARYGKEARAVVDHSILFPLLATANTEGVKTVLSQAGYPAIRWAMRAQAAQYGVGSDGRYYFGDFWWSESGTLAAMMMLQLAFLTPTPFGEIVANVSQRLPAYGPLRFDVEDPEGVIKRVAARVSETMNIDGGPREMVSRSKAKDLDFRVVLRADERDDTLLMFIEGNGVSPGDLDDLAQAFADEILEG